MKKINTLLVFLISSLAITGVSFIDGKIWDIIFFALGLITYYIVGVLFSIGILSTKEQGRGAYALVFFLLIISGYFAYKILEALRQWILSWPLIVKVVVISVIVAIIIVCIVIVIRLAIKNKNNQKDGDEYDEEE